MTTRAFTILLLGVSTTAVLGDEPKKPNRLATESSPYLLQHRFNPVDWHPWGQEAFDRAKKENKLVFLSIGYSSCHWCHVMERESFENAAVAKLLNDHFVCVKVDREERPDVDDVYMTALNVTGRTGGWPLTMFLTPDGKPIFGGTYFPPDDKVTNDGTAPGLKTTLKRVVELDRDDRAGLVAQADRMAAQTAAALARSDPPAPLDRSLVTTAVDAFTFDPVHGGLGDERIHFARPKFPRAAALSFLQQQSRKPGNERLAGLMALSLRKMVEGGIYDHVGGGFHRYSTERTWTVPHFEKMLSDNAQLMGLYADAYRAVPDPLYRRVVAETAAFVRREMTDAAGAFYSALDADSDGTEGRLYVWTPDELRAAAGPEIELVRTVYGAAVPNFEEQYHVLRLPKPTAELAAELKTTEAELLARLDKVKAKLLAERAKRPRPFLDTKVIAAWNGQMIAGLARAGEVFREPSYTAAAAKAADFVLTKMRDKDGRLFRLYAAAPGKRPAAHGAAFLDDYAYLLDGLLSLHDATGERRWLDESKAVADVMVRWHGDALRGGCFYTAHDHEKLFARAKDAYDGAQPSGNGVAARALLRLGRKTGDPAYQDQCVRTLTAFAGRMRTSPASVPTLCRCLDELLDTGAVPGGLEVKRATPATPRESADVVAGTLAVDGRAFTVTLTVADPWYVYANPVGTDSLKAAETTVEVRVGGTKVEAAVEYPAGAAKQDATAGGYRVYAGRVAIRGTLPADGPAEVRVRVAACRDGLCLLPSVIVLK